MSFLGVHSSTSALVSVVQLALSSSSLSFPSSSSFPCPFHCWSIPPSAFSPNLFSYRPSSSPFLQICCCLFPFTRLLPSPSPIFCSFSLPSSSLLYFAFFFFLHHASLSVFCDVRLFCGLFYYYYYYFKLSKEIYKAVERVAEPKEKWFLLGLMGSASSSYALCFFVFLFRASQKCKIKRTNRRHLHGMKS